MITRRARKIVSTLLLICLLAGNVPSAAATGTAGNPTAGEPSGPALDALGSLGQRTAAERLSAVTAPAPASSAHVTVVAPGDAILVGDAFTVTVSEEDVASGDEGGPPSDLPVVELVVALLALIFIVLAIRTRIGPRRS